MNTILNYKNIKYIILLGLVLNIIFSNIVIDNYDKLRIREAGDPVHSIVRSDTEGFFNDADILIKRFKSKEKPLINTEYFRSFLPQISIATYFYLIDEELYETQNFYNEFSKEYKKIKVVKSENGKLGFFIIQIFIYFFSVFFLIKNLSKFFPEKYLFVIATILSFEPTINQYHSSFFSESIYFSFLIWLIILVINLNKKIFHYIILGLLLGLMYAQRSISIGLFIPIYLFLFYKLKFKSITPVIIITICMSLIISLIGFSNYKRTGVFYFTPYQAKVGFYHYVGIYLISKDRSIELKEAKKIHKEIKEQWIEKYNLDLNNEVDRLKFYELQKNYSVKLILNNPIEFSKYHIWKSLQTIIIDPFQVYKDLNLDKTKGIKQNKKYWEIKDTNYYILLSICLIYSILIYFFSLIGLISFILKKAENFKTDIFFPYAVLFLVIIIYFVVVSGWIGNPRYFSPCMIFLVFFTAEGIINLKILKKLFKKFS